MLEPIVTDQLRELVFEPMNYDMGGVDTLERRIALAPGIMLEVGVHRRPRDDDSLNTCRYQFFVSGGEEEVREEYAKVVREFLTEELMQSDEESWYTGPEVDEFVLSVEPEQVAEFASDVVLARLEIGHVSKRCLVNEAVLEQGEERDRYLSYLPGKLTQKETEELLVSDETPSFHPE